MTTGTTESQLERVQKKIEKLQAHLSLHRKDNPAKKSILKSQNQARTLRAYAARQELKRTRNQSKLEQ